MNDIKTILLIGKTGSGKSTLANVLLGKKDENGTLKEPFGESAGSTSETKKVQIEETDEIDGIKYRIVDTVGVGDTGMSLEKILRKIALTGYSVRNGLSQIFFVTDGYLSKESKLTYDLLSKVIFDEEILKYTTIIRTGASWLDFDEERYKKYCEEDKEEIIEGSKTFKKFIESCREIIYVDNPPQISDNDVKSRINNEKREKSRNILVKHLKNICHEDEYEPINLLFLSSEIDEHMKKKEELKRLSKKKEKNEKKLFNNISSAFLNVKDILSNKSLNVEITKRMLNHIGNIDKNLKKSIEEELKNLEDKGQKVADWRWLTSEKNSQRSQEELEIINDLNRAESDFGHVKSIKEAISFLKSKMIFLKKREEIINELKRYYNELNNFVNIKYAKQKVRAELITSLGDSIDFDIRVNPIKVAGAMVNADYDNYRINVFAKMSKKFSSCLEKDRNSILLLKEVYNSLENSIYKERKTDIDLDIIDALELEDATKKERVQTFKCFEIRYEKIYEIANDWKTNYFTLESMEGKLNSLVSNLNELNLDLKKEIKFLKQSVENRLSQISQQEISVT